MKQRFYCNWIPKVPVHLRLPKPSKKLNNSLITYGIRTQLYKTNANIHNGTCLKCTGHIYLIHTHK